MIKVRYCLSLWMNMQAWWRNVIHNASKWWIWHWHINRLIVCLNGHAKYIQAGSTLDNILNAPQIGIVLFTSLYSSSHVIYTHLISVPPKSQVLAFLLANCWPIIQRIFSYLGTVSEKGYYYYYYYFSIYLSTSINGLWMVEWKPKKHSPTHTLYLLGECLLWPYLDPLHPPVASHLGVPTH